MRLPRSPGYGGRSKPGSSSPSNTHFTIRAMSALSFAQGIQEPLHRRRETEPRGFAERLPAALAAVLYRRRPDEGDLHGFDVQVEMAESMPQQRPRVRRTRRGAEARPAPSE